MTQLRDYQAEMRSGFHAAWHSGARNVLGVLPTGGGKTVLFSEEIAGYPGPSCAIAHRQELVSQISLALGKARVRHGLLAPKKITRAIVQLHMEELGVSYYDPTSRVKVAGVDTLVRMEPDTWSKSVGLWVIDEAHHVLKENKWGRAAAMFPNAYGLGVTATPCRADGKGLGRHADGLFDRMVQGPPMRRLIERGYLTPYRIFAPPSDIDLSGVTISAGGDYNPDQLRAAVHKSRVIVGDVVGHYLKHARGKRGVTFAVDVEHATEMAAAYRAAGVPAAVITGDTSDTDRIAMMRQFRAGTLLQLCNCDLLGEGVDVPAIEVVSFARPTMSFSLYCQQFGRALRILLGKLHAIIIDHVGNVAKHGLPDARRVWSLDARERGLRSARPADVMPTMTCRMCTGVFERTTSSCPYCGYYNEPSGRSAPEMVDGALHELTEDVLARMRGEIDRVDGAPTFPYGAGPEVVGSIKKRHWERQQAQQRLREAMMLYGGLRTAAGDSIEAAQRRFFHTYGLDVMSAQALGAREAAELEQKLRSVLQ